MPKKEKSFLVKAKDWAGRHGLHGKSAFSRYIMFVFAENVNKVSDDFVFKGGNLLWVYIRTPRATIDLDFATKTIKVHREVRAVLDKACGQSLPDVSFRIRDFKEVAQDEKSGAACTVEYKTQDGAANYFDLDIVYAIGEGAVQLPSPLKEGQPLEASPLEKIIADKVSTCHRFKGGNTRMKDFDDLWRISLANNKFDEAEVRRLLAPFGFLDTDWVNKTMEARWENHRKPYPDLPPTIAVAIDEINNWLKKFITERKKS